MKPEDRDLSIASTRIQNGRDGLHHDHEVTDKAAVGDVKRVELHPLDVVRIASSANLPQSRKAGTHADVIGIVLAVVYRFTGNDRTRSDHAHMTKHDIDELRDLVDAALAQECPERRDARIVLQLARCRPFGPLRRIGCQVFLKQLFVIVNHRPELQAWEHSPAASDPAMSDKNRLPLNHKQD